jgi:hypothetical protein
MSLGVVPVDVFQYMVYELGILNVQDIRALVLTTMWIYNTLVGDRYGRHQFRAMTGPLFCIKKHWWASAHLALTRNIGLPCTECVTRTIQGGRMGLLKRLLTYKCINLNRFTPVGNVALSPICAAVRTQRHDMLDMLLETDRLWNDTIARGMKHAVCVDDIGTWIKLIERNGGEYVDCSYMLTEAVENNRVEMAKIIMDHPKSILSVSDMESMFQLACRLAYSELVRLFIPWTPDDMWEFPTQRSRIIETVVGLNDAESMRIILDDPRSRPHEIQPQYIQRIRHNPFWKAAAQVLIDHPLVCPGVDFTK